MTARELILSNIQLEEESNQAYFRRLASESDSTFDALKMQYYKLKRKFVVTQQKKDKNGNVTSTTEKLQSTKLVLPPEHLEVSRVSTNESTGQQWVIHTKESQNKALFELNKETIRESVKELDLKPLDVPKKRKSSDKVLKVTLSDVHVGLNITENLYGLRQWNKKELFRALKRVVSVVTQKFDGHKKIVVAEYGDFMDGLDGQTTRKGHRLDQNMTNEEAYIVGTKFKIELAKELAKFGVPLEFYSLTNDNHSGSFSEMVNYHVKEVLKYILPDVKYIYFKDFISHYFIGDWCFVCTHGKDAKHMKFGFNTKPDDKAKTHINTYIDKHNLHKYRIVFEMGDRHVLIRDCSNKKFEYNVYFALSPASDWVQTNFAGGIRGFCVEEIYKDFKDFTMIKLD